MRQCVSLGIMAEHIGTPAAAALALRYGGRDVYIPKRKTGKAYDDFYALIGADASAELVRVFGGERIYIAKDARAEKRAHSESIAAQRAAGKTWCQIASSYVFPARFSERWVRKLGGEAVREGAGASQMDMFEPPKSPSPLPTPHPLDALSRRT